jgi:lysophospholipase L1-like esterase
VSRKINALFFIIVAFARIGQAQLADDFKTPRQSNCCLSFAAKSLLDQLQDFANARLAPGQTFIGRMRTLVEDLQDWNQLSFYNDANKPLRRNEPAKGRIVFMGDSITANWKLDKFFPNKPYINRGISGQTSAQMLVRMFPDVIDLKPQVVVILAGINDVARVTGPSTANMIEENIEAMTELASSHGIRVILCSITPVSDYTTTPQTKIRPPADILKLNGWIKSYAAGAGAIWVDYYSALVDERGMLKDVLSQDGLHPNERGYNLIAPILETAIQEALSK